MLKKITAVFSALLIFVTSFTAMPTMSALADVLKSPVLEYNFDSDGSDEPTLYGNAQYIYDKQMQSYVLSLDGEDGSYAELPQGFFDNMDTLTVSMNIKPQTDSGNFFTFTFGQDSTLYNFLRIRDSEIRNAITVNSYSNEQEVKANKAKTDCWMNLVLVIDETVSRIYVNGELAAENTNTGITVSDLGTDLISYIGKSFYDDSYYKGCFEDFKVYDYALSDEEISSEFDAQIELFDLLYDVTVGTTLDEVEGNYGTDEHTAVSAEIDENNEINSYVKYTANIEYIPVTFDVLADEAVIKVDGNDFENGSRLDLSSSKTVTISYGSSTEEYTLNTPQFANNAVLPGQYADPDIDYFDGKYWICPTTDGYSGWSGTEFHLWSSTDMIDWTDEGVILDVASDDPGVNSNGIQVATSEWSDGSAWAPTIEKKNDKYYFYYCGNIKSEYTSIYGEGKAIGVAVADSPEGPYVASDEPLIYPSLMSSKLSDFSGQVIDPSIFTDDDGTSYIFFGNGSAAYSKLSDDMLSLSGTMRLIENLTDFRESIVVFKKESTYYFTWSCDDTGSEDYHVNYGTASRIAPIISSSKTFSYVSYKGTLLSKDTDSDILGTGHQSILYLSDIDKCYIAYGRFYTPLGQVGANYGYHRETCIDEVTFGSSNTLNTTTPTMEGITGLCPDGHETTVEYTYPTCTQDGYITITCSGGEYTNIITAEKATDFAAYGHSYVKTVIEETCTEDGSTVYTCSRCGDEYSTDFVSAVGHMFVYDDTDDTCFRYVCENCNEVEEKTAQELTAMWDVKYINSVPHSTAIDDSSYFELHKDGIINAKDYSVLEKKGSLIVTKTE